MGEKAGAGSVQTSGCAATSGWKAVPTHWRVTGPTAMRPAAQPNVQRPPSVAPWQLVQAAEKDRSSNTALLCA